MTLSVKTICFNAHSLNNKLVELYSLLEGKLFSNNKCDVIDINETWLNISSPDSLLINGLSYNVYRKDRPSRGGGVFDCF